MAQGYIDPDYVDVAERIRLFYERYPDGRLATVTHGILHAGDKVFVYAEAHAYRTADDPQPCSGTAWEPIPGPTPFTRDSELMNAETAAWGRAIVAAGIPSKKIASADEMQARTVASPRKTEPPSRKAGTRTKKLRAAQIRLVTTAKDGDIDEQLRHRIIRRLTEGATTSVHDLDDDACDKITAQLKVFAAYREAGMENLEKWEAQNG